MICFCMWSGYLTRHDCSSSSWKGSSMLKSSRISRRESNWYRLAEIDKSFISLVALSISSSPSYCTSFFIYEKHFVGFTAELITWGQNPQIKSTDTSVIHPVMLRLPSGFLFRHPEYMEQYGSCFEVMFLVWQIADKANIHTNAPIWSPHN